MSRVLVGMSGGVDSSVTALLLQQQGFEVEGILLKQLSETGDCDDSSCCAESAIARARKVCNHLGITLHAPDARTLFNKMVIGPSIEVWSKGGIPSPCTSCNADVRAPLLNYYKNVLQCEYFATGHYFINKNGVVYRGTDPSKDQSYMVSLVGKELLNSWLTPLGNIFKKDVRSIAAAAGIATASTPDSQNLCFNHLLPSFDRGVFRIEDGDLIQIGRHAGRPAIGQRKSFGGYTVLSVNSDSIVVGSSPPVKNVLNVRWANAPPKLDDLIVQVAYHGKNYDISEFSDSTVTLADHTTTSPGQTIAVYKGDELVGGGTILS